jgi:predicted methyltransferase
MRRYLFALAAALGFAASALPADATVADDVENCAACEAVLDLALANPRRDADRGRDNWRRPAETLAFFRVRPGMTVVDYMPADGWWTRVLAPYLGEDGRYIGLNPDVTATFPARAAEWTGLPATRIAAYNTDGLPAALSGTVDRVLIFRVLHNLKRLNMLPGELKAAHGLLRPDGLLGIEQHRAKPHAPDAYADGSKGYLRERDVIAMVEAQGFTFVARSEINANPRDPANHEDGVWALLPSLRLGETDRTRYLTIGESDRMTLLFRKRA